MSLTIVLLFATIFISQVSSQCDTFTSTYNVPYDIDYCSCAKNVTAAKSKIDSFYNAYYARVLKIRTKVNTGIKTKVQEILASKNCNQYYYKTEAEYVYSIFGICAGIVVQADLKPIWRQNSKLSDEETCTWIVSHAPELYGEINHNHVAFEHCDFDVIFDKYFYKNFQDCKAHTK